MNAPLSPEQEEKKQGALASIKQIPLDSAFKLPNGFPVPLRDYLFVKKLNANTNDQITEGGIILTPSIASNNTTIPHVGIIFAVGYECSEFVIPGQKVMYNPFADFEIIIKGVSYIRMQERDILGIITPDTWVYRKAKSARQVFREERFADEGGYQTRKKAHDANEADNKEFIEKKGGKIKTINLKK